MATTKLIPPDGGYGWVIVSAVALHHFISFPISQGFGLLFKDAFKDLEFTATDTSFIMNTNAAFSMFVGMMVAPLLKHLGYRKVALMGGSLITVGVLLTAQAQSFVFYLISYGLITALGNGIGMAAYSLALNSFFMKKRSKAAGYAFTICGFGPVIMPQVFSFLLDQYGIKAAITIVGALAGHTFVSSLLLQPIKWHMKAETIEDEVNPVENGKLLNEEQNDNTAHNRECKNSILSLEEGVQVDQLYDADSPLVFTRSALSLYHGSLERPLSMSARNKSFTNAKFYEGLELKDVKSFVGQNKNIERIKQMNDANHAIYTEPLNNQSNTNEKEIQKKKVSLAKRIGKRIVDLFDLTLLKSPSFVNMVIGMSSAVFAEMNFTILTPFIMQDFGLDTQQIATFMSTISIADICFRFIAPYVSDFFNKPARVMYMWALVLLILSRSSLLLTDNYYGLLGCAAFLGLSKGFRMVFWALVMPSSVPIERLAAAAGLQSTLNGFLVWAGGPFIAAIRDATGSFRYCIVAINFLSFITIVMWTTEFVYVHYKSKKKSSRTEDISS